MLKKKNLTWNQNCLIFIILDGSYKKLLSDLKSIPWNLSKCKVPRTFGTGIWENCCPIWNEQPGICQDENFYSKQKTLCLGQKIPYFGSFRQ